MNIREKITAWEPGAVWSEAGDGMFTVPVEKFHDLAARLRAEGFDFLRSLTGMDWGEEGFGAVYHLEATATGENVVLRTLTPSREKCGLPSVCDLWKAAELNEREVFDYFGIGFLNHPDMRRLFLRDDWVGHPLRKDYDPGLNPLRMTNEVSKDSAPSFELTADGSFILTFLGDGKTEFQLELTWLRDHPQKYDLGECEFHLALAVEDMEKAHALHEKLGCICYENPAMGIYFISDPDGYWVEIIPTK